MVELKSLSGLAEPIEQDVQIEVGAPETLAPFNEALIGASPGEAKEVDVTVSRRLRTGAPGGSHGAFPPYTKNRPPQRTPCAG